MANDFNNYAKEYSETVALINALDTWVYIKHLPKERSCVLDIGCGSGDLLKSLDSYFKTCYGIDTSKNLLDIAKQKVPDIVLTFASANTLPYPDNYFDYVVSHTAFHHLNLPIALDEAKRVLKPGGTLVIADVAKEGNKSIRVLSKIVFRLILSTIRMGFKYGLSKTLNIYRFLYGPVWRNHIDAEQAGFLTKQKFRKIYSAFLPKATFGNANYSVDYVVWIKP